MKWVTLVRRWDKKGKAGPWEILYGPDDPPEKHLGAWQEAVVTHPRNETFAAMKVCRLDDIQRELEFSTAAQLQAQAEEQKKFEEQASLARTQAQERAAKIVADAKALEDKAHAERVAQLSKEHDKIRTQKIAA